MSHLYTLEKSILANKTRELIFTLQSQPTSQIFPQKFMDYIKKLKICITIELESSHKNGYLGMNHILSLCITNLSIFF